MKSQAPFVNRIHIMLQKQESDQSCMIPLKTRYITELQIHGLGFVFVYVKATQDTMNDLNVGQIGFCLCVRVCFIYNKKL